MSPVVIRTLKSKRCGQDGGEECIQNFVKAILKFYLQTEERDRRVTLGWTKGVVLGDCLEQVLKLCPVAGFGTNCVKP